MIAIFLILLLASASGCEDSSECPDASTCEVGLCSGGNCTTETVCTCGDGTLEPPWEECDYVGPLCSDCVRLGACLRWEGGLATCQDETHASFCASTGGLFARDAQCVVKTACCDAGECSMEVPGVCFGLGGRPRGNRTCAEEHVCDAGCCCSASLLYGNYSGGISVALKSDCCGIGGKLVEEYPDCGALGYDPVDLFPLVCDFGACTCVGAAGTGWTCSESTRDECDASGCDFVPLAGCGPKDRGGRCGATCKGLFVGLSLGLAALAMCCGCVFWFIREDDKEHEE